MKQYWQILRPLPPTNDVIQRGKQICALFLLSTFLKPETSFADIVCVLVLPRWLSKIQNAFPLSHNSVRLINHHELFMN
jgi:hypothetical protein